MRIDIEKRLISGWLSFTSFGQNEVTFMQSKEATKLQVMIDNSMRLLLCRREVVDSRLDLLLDKDLETTFDF